MKKNLPLIILVLVVVAVAGVVVRFVYNGDPKQDSNLAQRDVKQAPAQIIGDDSSSGKPAKEAGTQKKVDKSMEQAEVPDVDPKQGEMMVWGELKAIDVDKRIVTIDQHMDDNSVRISPNAPIEKEAVIRTKEKVISFSELKPGDIVGMIVRKDGQARAVLVNY